VPATLPASQTLARKRRWARPYVVLDLTLYRDQFGASPSSLTLHLSTEPSPFPSERWDPIVLAWGPLSLGALGDLRPSGAPATAAITLSNARPVRSAGAARFTDLFRHGSNAGTGTYDWALARATVRVWFGLPTGAVPAMGDVARTWGKLRVDDVVAVEDGERAVLRLVGEERYLDVRLDTLVAGYQVPSIEFYAFNIYADITGLHYPLDPDGTSLTWTDDGEARQKLSDATRTTWLLVHRRPTAHPGATIRLPLKRNAGQLESSYDLVARATTLPGSLSALQAITWTTNPPTPGAILASQHFTPGVAPTANVDFDVPLGVNGADLLVRIENSGNESGDTTHIILTRDGTVTFP
jgi:hypothetical protein